MKLHANARLTPTARLLLCRRVLEEGRSLAEAAEAAGVSERTARKWLARYRTEGEAGLGDRSSRPHTIPRRTSPERERAVLALRRTRMTGEEIAACLQMPARTVQRILRRGGLGRLRALEPTEPANRFETPRPGQLVHVDVKTLARIDRAGHRVTGSRRGRARGAWAGSGCTWPSTGPPAWPTSSSCPTSAPRRPAPSWSGRWPGSPPRASGWSAC
jgi:transposase